MMSHLQCTYHHVLPHMVPASQSYIGTLIKLQISEGTESITCLKITLDMHYDYADLLTDILQFMQ